MEVAFWNLELLTLSNYLLISDIFLEFTKDQKTSFRKPMGYIGTTPTNFFTGGKKHVLKTF